MGYKQYLRGTRRITEEPMVTIGGGSAGNIYLNTFTMKNYLQGIKHVALYYDDDRKCFAVKPLKSHEKGTYALGYSSQKSKSTGYVAARGFVNLPFISKSRGRRLKAFWNEKEGFLEVRL